MKRTNRGITLIALIITIIVLLILAGVSIATLTGQNGILEQANNAKMETRIGEIKEKVRLWKLEQEVNEYTGTEIISEEKFIENLKKEGLILDNEVDEENKIISIGGKNIYYGGDEENANTNIFNYNEFGLITGIKEEYFEDEANTINVSKRIASLKSIKISGVPGIQHKYLKKELGGIIKIPSKINETEIIGIENEAFKGIGNLTKVILSSKIQYIGEEAFYMYEELSDIEFKLSSNPLEIGSYAFFGTHLKKIDLPNNTVAIGEQCFGTTDIENDVYIPSSVQTIGQYAFTSVAFSGGTINCEITAKPEGWSEDWNCIKFTNGDIKRANVNWGQKR